MKLGALNDAVVTAWAYLRRRQIVSTNGELTKVNLGCGLRVAPGWINVDVNVPTLVASWPEWLRRRVYRMVPASSAIRGDYSEAEFCQILAANRFVHHNISYGLPFKDGSVDFIYTSHFVEHLFLTETRGLLREAMRVLKPGGVLRIAVPDLEYVMSLYAAGQKERALAYFFHDVGPSYFTRHKYMYDLPLLKAELERGGFICVRRCECRQGVTPDIDALDNRDEETLYVETAKAQDAGRSGMR
jgi:predicted SAM-dependent methyltransferase